MKIYRDWLALAVILALLLTVAGCTQSLAASPVQNPTTHVGRQAQKDL